MDADDLLESIPPASGDDAPARLATRPAPRIPRRPVPPPRAGAAGLRGAHAGGHGARRRDPRGAARGGAPASAGKATPRVTFAEPSAAAGDEYSSRPLSPPGSQRDDAKRRAHARG